MQKRSLSIVLLVVAFLFSAWGNVLAATFCPRYLANRHCCVKHVVSQPKQVESQSSCHPEMAGMEMGNLEKETETSSDFKADNSAQSSETKLKFESSSEQVALDLPIEQCAHCWSHSQPTSGTSFIAAVDPSRRLVETNSSPAELAVVSHSVSPISITPTEHGPPGVSLPRQVLINVFRI